MNKCYVCNKPVPKSNESSSSDSISFCSISCSRYFQEVVDRNE